MRRLRRWQKVLIGTCLSVVLPALIGWIVTDRMAAGDLRQEIRRIEAAGESLDLADVVPPEVPDQENAALVYEQAFAVLDETSSETEDNLIKGLSDDKPWDEKKRRDIAKALYRDLRGMSLADRLFTADDDYDTEALPDLSLITEAAAWEAARERLKRNEKALDLIARATAMPRCRFDINYSAGFTASMPHLGHLRSSARLLVLRARVRRRDGDFASAHNDVLACFRLARAIREPEVVCHLVGVLIRHLALDEGLKPLLAEEQEPHPAQWRALLEELQGLDQGAVLVSTLQGERALGMLSFGSIAAGPGGGAPRTPPKPGWVIKVFLSRAWLNREKANYLRYMTGLIEAARLEPWEMRERLAPLYEDVEKAKWANLTRILAPALAREIRYHVLSEANVDLARVALALRLHKHEHGAYPERLDVMTPSILKTIPKDAFTGQPLVYRLVDSGFVVYSVGLDDTDNDGNEEPPDRSNRDQGVDIVWKVKR